MLILKDFFTKILETKPISFPGELFVVVVVVVYLYPSSTSFPARE